MAPRRVLIADDDRDLAESLADVLELKGFEVGIAFNGDAAMECYRAQPTDLALLDVRMPGKDGIACCLELRALDPTMRVVLMTGYAADPAMQRAHTSGAAAVIEKPFDLEAVLILFSGDD
jgi:DNA-binding NtrC family response regulator